MSAQAHRQKDEVIMVVAVLHDLVEDTPVTLEQLEAARFSEEIIAAVACLTKSGPTLSPGPTSFPTSKTPWVCSESTPPRKTGARLQRYHRAWQELRP
jgi:hypothetical protein